MGCAPDGCTLPTAEQPLREAEWDRLFGSLVAMERTDGARLRLRLSPGPAVEAAARELTAKEAGCCSFFSFTVVPAADAVRVDVEVPADRADVLDWILARAVTTAGVVVSLGPRA